jgi:hypothetical protein
MTPEERLTKFREKLAEIVAHYDIEISCEHMTPIACVPGDDPMDCIFEFPSNASPKEIAEAEIILTLRK